MTVYTYLLLPGDISIQVPGSCNEANRSSAHWLAISHGAMSQSMPIVTAYDTLGEDGLRASLSATKAKAIFLEPGLLRIFTKVLPSADAIQYVVYNTDSFDELLPEDLEALKRGKPGLKILSFEELRSLGEENPVVPTPPHANDLCCIMYTSGTGGSPKGVLLKHSNVVAAGKGLPSCRNISCYPGSDKTLFHSCGSNIRSDAQHSPR